MKIAQVARFEGYINGGASGEHRLDPNGLVFGAIGRVSSATMWCGGDSAESKLLIVVDGEEVELCGSGLPRIDVGEDVVVHQDEEEIVAIQVIKDGEAIFRLMMPGEGFRHGSTSYEFVD